MTRSTFVRRAAKIRPAPEAASVSGSTGWAITSLYGHGAEPHTAAREREARNPTGGSVDHMGSAGRTKGTRASGAWTAVVLAVAVRPGLWATAIGQVFRLSPVGWWRRAPFVPVPDPEYVRFRVATQYGGSGGAGSPDPNDVVEYLRWCRSIARPRGRPSGSR
jgi:hypothetical protein